MRSRVSDAASYVEAPVPAGRTVSTRLSAALGLVSLGACALLIAVGAAGGDPSLVPAARVEAPGWLVGPLSVFDLRLGPVGFDWLFLGMCASYAVVLMAAGALRARTLLAGIVALHLIFLASPPLFSADAFGYIAFARLGAIHHVDPYAHSLAAAAPLDAVFPFVRWHHLTSPYGPLFTAASYAIAPLGVAGSFWALKAIAALSSLGLVALVWRLAKQRGGSPNRAAAFVGLNPLLLVFGVGGAHNDFLVTLIVMAGVMLALQGRELASGATLVAATAMKASAGLLLPFLVAGSRRRRNTLAGIAAALAAVSVLAVTVFGGHAAGFAGQVGLQQHQIAAKSIPNALGRLLGLGGLTVGLRLVVVAAFAAALAVTLDRARRRDWITAAGWATLALLLTSAWLLPWYVVWLLPLAAVSRDRRLEYATLAFCAYVVGTRITTLIG